MKDRELEKLVKKEIGRQEETLDLIASENIASPEILSLLGSALTNKYSEGYPGKRYYPGNVYYDEIEKLAQARALKLFKLSPKNWAVNVQPYSGSPANLAIYAALLKPGETLMGMKLSSGGHLTHGHGVSLTGQFYHSVQYAVDEETGLIDFGALRKLAKEHKPRVIVCGFTAYPRKINFKAFSEIAKEVDAYLVADISHIAGLVSAGLHPSPFPYAQAVMTTTHKTLRGPRGAVIFSRLERLKGGERTIAEAVDRAVFPGLQGGPHNNETAAKARAFFEAARPEFKKYAARVVKNASVLASELKRGGLKVITGGTDTHLILVDVRSFGLDGLTAEKRLEKNGIIANRNSVPGDPSPFKPSGLRLGTPALTTRGLKEKDMKLIADLILKILKDDRNLRSETRKICERFSVKKLLKE
ncbi:MAG TPA: serine hydroxymethyltransferase [Candidatus Tyrphobacter sp.]|nr:serine hydroxymethyltransferase [Candidatus Tyrphobacter sp.]